MSAGLAAAGRPAATKALPTEAIVLPWRTGAAPGTTGVPRVLLLAAGDTAAAAAWGRSLAGEGWAVECRAAAPPVLCSAFDDASTSPAQGPAPAPLVPPPAPTPAEALVLHVADSLAPQLAPLRALRAQWPQLPLLAVVRGLRELDQVLALEMGADDVVDATLGAPVVAARLRALGRRAEAATLAAAGSERREPPRELRFGALRLRRLEREALLGEVVVPLTEGEFEVLWLLASHAGQALSRREILKRVRGLDDQPMDRSIDSRVYRIRAKLGDNQAHPPRIRTVRHQGYAFSPAGW